MAGDRGAYLSVEPTGGKLWRLKYRFGGKERKLSFGSFQDVGLKVAHSKRDAARQLLASGIDLGAHKRRDRLNRALATANTFQAVTEEFIAKREREGFESVTIAKVRCLSDRLSEKIGRLPIKEITLQELLVLLRG